MPNDDTANAVISVLQRDKIPPKTFPTTGQDASPSGLQNILKGYQCGTVYKPVYEEAQAAAAIALYLRAGLKPPSTLVNAETMDSKIGKNIPSVYTVPTWVTTSNMAQTVVKDEAVQTTQLCSGGILQKACQAAGIS
jgi:D-xylose transport system substrate-binding protein